MVHIGIAGIGFMGVTHYKALAEVETADVAAICTRDPKKLAGDWGQVQGNFGGKGGVHDLSALRCYGRIDELIADDRIDLVDVCLPSAMHASVTVAALEAGKHVLVEKPIALTVEDADRMIASAQANGRQLMVGQVLRFWPDWRLLRDAVADGRYGRLLALNLRRIISKPDWSDQIADIAANGGPLIDLHIHDADFLLFVLGRPQRVVCSGRSADGHVIYISSQYDYGEDGPIVSCQSGAAAMPGRPFKHAYEACFERGTLSFSGATQRGACDAAAEQSESHVLRVYDDAGGVTYPQTDGADGFVLQLQHVAQCAAEDRPSPIIDGRFGRDALKLVKLEGESLRRGESLEVRMPG
jgi:predicted dehydrogenase